MAGMADRNDPSSRAFQLAFSNSSSRRYTPRAAYMRVRLFLHPGPGPGPNAEGGIQRRRGALFVFEK